MITSILFSPLFPSLAWEDPALDQAQQPAPVSVPVDTVSSQTIPCFIPILEPSTDRFACGSSEVLPEGTKLSWIFKNTENDFFEKMDQALRSLPKDASEQKKAEVIYNEFQKLNWRPVQENGVDTQKPSGKTIEEMLVSSVGNCVDVTNLLLGIYRHYGFNAYPVFFPSTDSDYNHVCLGVKLSDGASFLIDGTLSRNQEDRENGFNTERADGIILTDREFLALYRNAQGNQQNSLGEYQAAYRLYQSAAELCPAYPEAQLNVARYQTDLRRFENLSEAERTLQNLRSQGYVSGALYFAEGMLWQKQENTGKAQQSFEDVIEVCSTDTPLYGDANSRIKK